jgi:hypothetical protein
MNLQEQERDRASEQWLDEAIGHLRDAGPRTGLETRVLARLRVHTEQRRRRWNLILAGSAAVVLVVAVLASRPRTRQSMPEIVQQNPPAKSQASPVQVVANGKGSPKKEHRREFREISAASGSHSLILRPTVEPHEATFPSAAAPLNEQGRLLQAYLRQTPPQQLALIAARQPSLSSLESEDLNIASLQIADLTPKTEAPKDQDQK